MNTLGIPITWDEAKKGWDEYWDEIGEGMANWFADVARPWAEDTNRQIKATFNRLGTWFREDFIPMMKDIFREAGDAAQIMLDSLWEVFGPALAPIINILIDTLNLVVESVVSAINAVIGLINKIDIEIPWWVPFLGGKTFAPNITPLTPPKPIAHIPVPELAKGAVIPPNQPFAAILGDQRSGKNIEAPEGLIREIIQDEIGNIQSSVQVNFGGSMSELVRVLKPYIEKEDTRIGTSLVARSQT
jgi:hypothetical protein